MSIPTPASDAVSWILSDNARDTIVRLPSLDLLTMLDILNTLRRLGPQTFYDLLRSLQLLRKHNALALYLDSLESLGMVSQKREECAKRGSMPKRIYAATERGLYFLQFMESK
jgi:hypothetical protein